MPRRRAHNRRATLTAGARPDKPQRGKPPKGDAKPKPAGKPAGEPWYAVEERAGDTEED